MECPYCGADNDKVIDSRSTDGARSIRRRRKCLACSKRFTTYEYVERTLKLGVIKKDGSRVPYDRMKIMGGLEKACYKRPISVETLQQVLEGVEDELFQRGVREVEATLIGQTVAERLKSIDRVAYVRFASVYKQFRDLDDFLEEVRDVLEGPQPADPGQGSLFQG